MIGGVTFDGEEACVAFACAHMPREPTYHCIPSLMFVMCMPSNKVVYKSDMQGNEIHMARTSQNPMQSAVILSVNSTIPTILEGPKDSIQETKYNFNAARTFEDWMAAGMGGTSKNFHDAVTRAFERIKGAINFSLGDLLAKSVMHELHGDFLTHFRSIFTTEVTGYYQEILRKTGSHPPHNKEVKASCWALVTKFLKTIFKEIHKVWMFAAELGDVREEPAKVNGLFLYAVLEELRVLQDFELHGYRRHPMYNQCVFLHLFDTSLPRAVYEKAPNGPGRDGLCFTRIDGTLTDHKTSLDRLETVVGSIRSHLQLPAQGAHNRRRGGGGGRGGMGGPAVDEIE